MTSFPRTTYARMSDRLPHFGPAIFGPFVDQRARAADIVIFFVCIISAFAAWWLPSA